MNRAQNRVLIIGCGIAGPVLAVFLKEAGFDPLIFEKQPEPRDDTGFFLNLSPNGLSVLDTLGIKKDVMDEGVVTNRIIFQNHEGKKLAENPETTLFIKRGLLTKTLRKAAIAKNITVTFDMELKDVKSDGLQNAKAIFEGDTEVEGDFLIGCDGIHSKTRESIFPNAPVPQYLGVIDSGGFSSNSSISLSGGSFRMTFGTDGFFGYQVTPAGKIYWFENFVQKNEPDKSRLQNIPDEEWKNKLLNLHQQDHEPIKKIIRSTKNGIGKWPNYEVPSLSRWYKERVCLIGDAAHAMSPAAGQGASMAIEDAIVLAKCMRDLTAGQKAFASFQQLRKERVEKIAKNARRNNNQKGSTNVVTRWIRDLVLPFFLKMGINNARKTYSYNVDWSQHI